MAGGSDTTMSFRVCMPVCVCVVFFLVFTISFRNLNWAISGRSACHSLCFFSSSSPFAVVISMNHLPINDDTTQLKGQKIGSGHLEKIIYFPNFPFHPYDVIIYE